MIQELTIKEVKQGVMGMWFSPHSQDRLISRVKNYYHLNYLKIKQNIINNCCLAYINKRGRIILATDDYEYYVVENINGKWVCITFVNTNNTGYNVWDKFELEGKPE